MCFCILFFKCNVLVCLSAVPSFCGTVRVSSNLFVVCTVCLDFCLSTSCHSLDFLLCFFRDSVMEILFEQDNEEKSVASLILDALVKV